MFSNKQTGYKSILLLVVVVILVVSVLNPIYPKEMFLQHFATLFALIFMGVEIRKNRFSNFSYTFFTVFILLHIIGARWIYSEVPYNDWFITALGWDFQEAMGFERNHYDRFVHFGFGVLLFPILVEMVQRKSRQLPALLLAWLFIQTFSMIYEVFEWGLTLAFSNEYAENYNGQQGDMWDAQKDMALAMMGSSIMVAFYSLKS